MEMGEEGRKGNTEDDASASLLRERRDEGEISGILCHVNINISLKIESFPCIS
jgi:hypothetical protein